MQYYSVLESDAMCFETTWTENVPEPHEGLYINFSGSGRRVPSVVLLPWASQAEPHMHVPLLLKTHRQPRGLCFCPWSLLALRGRSLFHTLEAPSLQPTTGQQAGDGAKPLGKDANSGQICVCGGLAHEFLGTGTHCKHQPL